MLVVGIEELEGITVIGFEGLGEIGAVRVLEEITVIYVRDG